MDRLIRVQFLGPCFSTNRVRIRSSSELHGPFILSDLLESDHDDEESDDVEAASIDQS